MRNPITYFKYIAQEKRRYKHMLARAKALPEEYAFMFDKIQQYMWIHAAGEGMGMISILSGLLDLFEAGVTEGKRVLEITGADVATFCDELLRNTKTWTADWQKALNRDVRRKLERESDFK